MGSLTLPPSGLVYIDSVILIYTVEQYPAYWPALQPLWQAAQAGSIEVVSSELSMYAKVSGYFASALRAR